MSPHERAAMEAAAERLGYGMPAFERAWKAARAYQPPIDLCKASIRNREGEVVYCNGTREWHTVSGHTFIPGDRE